MFKYHVTKFFMNENNQVTNFSLSLIQGIRSFDYAQDFFNNKKLYSTNEEGSNVHISNVLVMIRKCAFIYTTTLITEIN